MATKKTTAKAAPKKRKAPAKKAAETKTTVASTTKTTVTTISAAARSTKKTDRFSLPTNLVNIVLAEVVGTFIFTLSIIALNAILAPLYAGLALAVIVLMIGGVSGAHVNPAVTFGLFTMRKLKLVLVPFYWAAQFLGAMAAVVLIGILSTSGVENVTGFTVDFGHFMDFSWSIFALELIGMAIFMFGIAAAITRFKSAPAATAVGVGSALLIGLLATSTLHPYVQKAAMEKFQVTQSQVAASGQDKPEDAQKYPREVAVNGATLNPAVALAVTEKTESQLSGNTGGAQGDEKAYSRLSLEVILATLIGAALGGNLFLLINYRNENEAS